MKIGEEISMTIQAEGYKYNFVNEECFSHEMPVLLNEETEEITLKLPNKAICWGSRSSTINPLIFANSLEKTPNIRKLNIFKLKGKDALLLEPIVNLFKERYPKKLTNVTVHTPNVEHRKKHLKDEIDQLYKNLMNNLANSHLTVLTIDDEIIGTSPLNSKILSDFFTKSTNLQTIEVCLKNEIKNLTIPFNLCPNLEQVTLENCHGITSETFQSLKDCKKLHTLILKDFREIEKLIEFLFESHDLNLHVLDFGNSTVLSSDYELYMIIKQLPDLEIFGQTHFLAHQNQITDEGLAFLGIYCPKLTSLSFCLEHITDSGFAKFVKRVKNLQKLIAIHANNLGEDSLVALAKNCPQLKSLELVHWNEITEPGLIALAEHCPQLEHLEISCCDNVSLDGVEKFIQNAYQLKTINVWLPDSSKEKEISLLKKGYSHLDWTSTNRRLKPIQLDPPKIIEAEEIDGIPKELLNKFLLESVRYERVEDIIKFVKQGADPNMTGIIESTPFTPRYKENPLALAALKGNLEIVKCLQELGANFIEVEKILGGLSQPEHLEVLKYLLANGCNPNVQGSYKMTPIQTMAAKNMTGIKHVLNSIFSSVSLDCVKALVSNGADTSVVYEEEYSLADIAKICDNDEIYEYFTSELKIPEIFKANRT